MTTRWLRYLAMVVAALVLAACGGGSGRGGTDLVVSAEGPPGELRGTQVAVFVMTVANQGENDAADVTLRNSLGNVMQLTGMTCEARGGAVCPAEITPDTRVPELKSGASLVIRVSAELLPGANGTLTNALSAVTSDDFDSSNNAATAIATAVASDTNVEASLSAPPYDIGVQHRFTAVFGNAGPAAAVDVVIRWELQSLNVLPDGEFSCEAADGATPPVLQDDGSLKAASLPVGATLICTLPVQVTDKLPFGASFNVSALGEAKQSDNTVTVRSNAP